MTFHILTIFPHIFDSYLKESLLGKAQKKGIIKIKIYNLRDFTTDPHRKVDDRPFGGGPGMVLKIEPIFNAIKHIKSKIKDKKKTRIILLSAKGEKFNQKKAEEYSSLSDLVLICGRYEGVDERVAKYIADEEISIGDYILAGGELPAMVIIEATSRLIPGMLGNIESLEEKRLESFEAELKKLELSPKEISIFKKGKNFFTTLYPVYTRPAVFSPDKKTSKTSIFNKNGCI